MSVITAATMMRTSRAQIDRILYPDKGNVTIETLQRAAALVATNYGSSWFVGLARGL